MNYKLKFIAQMNNSFHSGGMSTSLNDMQFSCFIQHLKKALHEGFSVKKAACCVGQQRHEDIWVLGPKIQIDCTGSVFEECELPYRWLDGVINSESSLFTAADLTPCVKMPFDEKVLGHLVNLLKTVMKHNFHSTLLVLAGGIMALHYKTITKTCKGCPTVIAYGPAETGKSTAIVAALGMTGNHH